MSLRGKSRLTETVSVLAWQLMLALVKASGPEQARAKSLTKGWFGIRTPTSYKEEESMVLHTVTIFNLALPKALLTKS